MNRISALLAAVLAISSTVATAAPISVILGDHPGGSLYAGGAGDPYGLRMDDQPPAGDGPTFSVGTNLGGLGGPVTLSWDDANLAAGATIAGTMWHNVDESPWSVTYTLTGLVDDGNGGWTATDGSGTVTENGGPGSFVLDGKQDSFGYAFVYANDGHRLSGSDGWVGRGWLQGGGVDDWLVVAVPVPAAAWLFGSALAMLGWTRLRRR